MNSDRPPTNEGTPATTLPSPVIDVILDNLLKIKIDGVGTVTPKPPDAPPKS